MRPIICLALALVACDKAPAGEANPAGEAAPSELVLYSGRSLSLVKPLIEKFEKASKIKVKVRDGDSGELAALLIEEGDKSPADVFWAQDADSLAQVEAAGLLAPLPAGLADRVDPGFRGQSAHWVPLSGRARVLAYNPAQLPADQLPKSVFDLTDPRFKGKIGWAPTNASFQGFVTALRVAKGEEAAEAWLRGVMANEPKAYPKNTPIIHALANGEIALGLPNHYYLLKEKAKDPNYPVSQTFFAAGDLGNLVNVAGAGVVKTSKRTAEAKAFIEYLLTVEAQLYFAQDVLEYPVVAGVEVNPQLARTDVLRAQAPTFDLAGLKDLKGTRDLLRKVGLL